ncbi:MAG TPA: hypothetical protein VFS91_04170 [Nitrobacter sp.]|nr:hypothetical protein [Nitrobacter sp.]
MAERLRKMHQESVRTKIQTSQLINRLSDHVLGSVELSPTQVRSAEVLLRKTLPDLSAVEMDMSIDDSSSLSVEQIDARIADLEARAAKLIAGQGQPDRAKGSRAKPDSVH